jgi:hypothetical protein
MLTECSWNFKLLLSRDEKAGSWTRSASAKESIIPCNTDLRFIPVLAEMEDLIASPAEMMYTTSACNQPT